MNDDHKLVKISLSAVIASTLTTVAFVQPAFGVGLRASTNSSTETEVISLPLRSDLPGRDLSRHPFLYAGEYNYPEPVQTLYVVRNGKVVWTYSIPTKNKKGELQEFGDAWMLSNGNILFTRKTGVTEVTPDKKIAWDLDAPKGCEIHSAQPIGLDRVLIMQNGKPPKTTNGVPAKAMLINIITGQVEKELLLPSSNTGPHGQFRHIRLTKAGTLLVAHLDWGNVVEYEWSGKEIWAWPGRGPWTAWAAVRLDNGNTLISGNGAGDVIEVNLEGKTVWQFSQKDAPNIKLYVVQEADRLANGNTVLCNWCASAVKPKDWPSTVQVLEVTPDKKVIWALRSWTSPANFGPATAIQLLDEPGVAENGDLQR